MMTPEQVAELVIANKEVMSELRKCLWDGFAAHNVAEIYEITTGHQPFEGKISIDWIKLWWEVRHIVHPKVKELKEKYGEYGKIP